MIELKGDTTRLYSHYLTQEREFRAAGLSVFEQIHRNGHAITDLQDMFYPEPHSRPADRHRLSYTGYGFRSSVQDPVADLRYHVKPDLGTSFGCHEHGLVKNDSWIQAFEQS